MALPKDRVIIATDVNERDGIGVEVYRDDNLLIEIFRDDTKRTRTVTLTNKTSHWICLNKVFRLLKKKYLGTLLITTT